MIGSLYAITARFLMELGHDVVAAADIGGSRFPDVDLLRAADDQSRVFVTRDKDFGSLVFSGEFGAGVVFLRVSPLNIQAVHQELARVLRLYPENQLKDAFVVVEAGRHRFRKLSRHQV